MGVLRLLAVLGLVCLVGAVGVPGKFKNLSDRKMRLFWVNFENEPYLNCYIRAGEENSFTTYETHRFFWAELHGPEVPTTAAGGQGVSFAIQSGVTTYMFQDSSSDPALVAKVQGELEFSKQYKQRTGEDWISDFPRHPPMFKFWEAPEIGFTHTALVDGEAAKWLCADESDPACRAPPETLEIKVQTIKPRSFHVENFMSDFECDHIIASHRPKMKRSSTGYGENARVEKVRSSKSSRMDRNDDHITNSVYARLARMIDMPNELITQAKCAESINIVEYQVGQEYTPHFDTGPNGGQTQNARFISALLYLNTPEGGGTTSFPASPTADGGEGVRTAAVKGNMMFFYDFLEDGNIDRYSMHAGEPVTAGEKWIGAAWIWEPKQAGGDWSPELDAQYRTSFVPSLFDRETGLPLETAEHLHEEL